MDFKSLVNLLSDRIHQHQVIEHYLTMVYKTGYKQGQENNLIDMQRQSIIILIENDKEPISRGNFKKLCEEFNLPYHSLKMLKFPITYKDSVIYKVEFK